MVIWDVFVGELYFLFDAVGSLNNAVKIPTIGRQKYRRIRAWGLRNRLVLQSSIENGSDGNVTTNRDLEPAPSDSLERTWTWSRYALTLTSSHIDDMFNEQNQSTPLLDCRSIQYIDVPSRLDVCSQRTQSRICHTCRIRWSHSRLHLLINMMCEIQN
jgi:hypothetical protein